MTTAFDPIDLSGLRLANRIAMAPMTRSRAYGPGATPSGAAATYYAQRASAGLIISEGCHPSAVGQGYINTPGLHTEEQTAAWRPVTDAVHAAGGRIFAQLTHTGRIGHPRMLPDGFVPVAPSPIAARGQALTTEGRLDFAVPEELDEAGIRAAIADYAQAARNAMAAGFDGVEIHGGNGYLIHQFLAPNTNHRTDAWGGEPEARVRFAVEVVTAVAAAVGAARTALRISPANPFNDIAEPEPWTTYRSLLDALNSIGPAYLHLVEPVDARDLTLDLRKRFTGTFVLNPATPAGRTTGPEELPLIEDGTADILAFGALFLANPDLPRRLAAGGPFNTPDRTTFYGGGEPGYTDYPTLP
ncbi:alkene reductase (plasmid) [Streptomyces sp. GDS52]|uniref:alkene reductase n=1 Tax=Streptomyces sp. GDS52 TaxID=3406419 RepID=UPI003FD43CDA